MFDLTPEEARLLLNVAMMATGSNRFTSAAKILAALERFRPGDPSLAAANAMLFISMGDFQGAVDYLDQEALPQHPDGAMLKAFKGMALLRMNRVQEARGPLQEAAEQSDDPAAAQLAKDMLV
ncbi:MAG: tetratricopeptide repeat protein [Kiritimatiellae bacterium]|nr:tetratricopeptide repeat protein [Kiritimatiellia bacterium]MBR4946735.1 tetratricopeptide repeat protein [Kiritimatiellia bacterium]MBR5587705.1 tetratricopeptide repeat protein [Kiritimatiellia bacterium]